MRERNLQNKNIKYLELKNYREPIKKLHIKYKEIRSHMIMS